jgi:hypothetical protein
MEKFTYATWQEDYDQSIDEYGDPQLFGDFGDYWLNIIEGCGLQVTPRSIELLERGIGGITLKELVNTQVGERTMARTANEPSLRRTGRTLLRIYLLETALEYSWPERMEAISDVRHQVLPRGVIQNLLYMLDH